MNLIISILCNRGSAERLKGVILSVTVHGLGVPPKMLQSCNLLILLGAFCFAFRTGQGTLELWLETGEKRQVYKDVIFEDGRQLVEKTTTALSSCQEAVLFHWQSDQQVFYEISEETSEELGYVATTIPRAGLMPYLLNTFLLYTKCRAVKEGDSGRAKVVLALFAVENGQLGEKVATVEMVFLKDCGSSCGGQDDDDDGRGHQGIVRWCDLCQNGGICTGKSMNDTPCTCAEGYSGMFCETPVCEPACQNGGHCFTPGRCLCKGGFSGPSCQEEGVSVCQSGCKNGGKCSTSGECSCPQGLLGPTCETRALEIVEDPRNTKLHCHRTATFKCKAKGTPTPHIRWYRNGSQVNTTASPRFKIVQHEGVIASSTLFLYGVQANDFGYYTCVATNEIASIHRHAYLVVLGDCQADAEVGSDGWDSEGPDWWTEEPSYATGDGEGRSDGEGGRERRLTGAAEEQISAAEESNLPLG